MRAGQFIKQVRTAQAPLPPGPELPAHLVCPADEVQVMLVQELGHHLSPEGKGDTSHSHPSPVSPCQGQTTAGRITAPDQEQPWAT